MSTRVASLAAVAAGIALFVPSWSRGADAPAALAPTPTPTPTSAPAPAPAAPLHSESPVLDVFAGDETSPTPQSAQLPTPLLSGAKGWQVGFFGWVEADALRDSTQSFSDTVQNATVARPQTIAGDNPRFMGSVRNSRIGLKASAPAFGTTSGFAFMEVDFFGLPPPEATQDQLFTGGIVRLRHLYGKLETPIVDVLAGQTFDLYGWVSQGFLVSTSLGILGEVFHRTTQLRVSHVFGGKPVGLEVAVAAARPAVRDGSLPDVQLGTKLTVASWKGALAQGPRKPSAAPMALGLSAVGRRLSVTDFALVPGNPHVVYAGGLAAQIFLPIIPAHGDSLSNALSLIGEYSIGTGLSDFYPSLTGGVLFPALPNPNNALPGPTYTPNIDNGIATYDAAGALHTIDWQGYVVGANYSLPFRQGHMFWISAVVAGLYSDNAVTLTPTFGQAFVWNKGNYRDLTAWWDITPSVQMALSYQTTTQRFGDAVHATNNRMQASWWMFF